MPRTRTRRRRVSPGPPQAAAREERRARWPRLSVRGVVRQTASLGWRTMSDATDLFAQARDDRVAAGPTATGDSTLPPLAVRMRPRSLDEVRGQADVLRPGSPLRRLVEGSGGAAGPLSAILWGPPGTGKTTLAHLVASAPDRRFVELSAVTAGVKDVREVMDAGPPRPRPVRPPDGALPRRDPPVHQGPAGRAAARRGEPLGRARRGDHREPVVQRHRPAAVPVGAAHAAPARRRRRSPTWSAPPSPTSAAWTAASRWPRTRGSTSCGSPAATPGGR